MTALPEVATPNVADANCTWRTAGGRALSGRQLRPPSPVAMTSRRYGRPREGHSR